MKNLDKKKVYKYNFSELRHLIELKSKYGNDYSQTYGASEKRVWYDGENDTKSIKNNIFRHIFFQSKLHCCYCNKLLIRTEREIDHFIPNADRPSLSFHPYNLIPSCGYCNSILKKKHNPEVHYNRKYSDSLFFIVHPYLNDIEEHIVFGIDEVSFDYDTCSIFGLNSIELFELYTDEAHIQRRNDLTIKNQMGEIEDDELIILIEKIASYK
jgi:hypothetical protein